jgi:NAD(P)-dependent dehydrogenase (short-subunit alcohol dehydrogenase family)
MGTYPELRGKKAIVTGGTAGIGKSTALCLAEEGVDVVVVGRDKQRGQATETMLRKWGDQSFFSCCDVKSNEDVKATCTETLRRFGKADILINCAGGFSKFVKVHEYDIEDWDNLLNTNLRSAFLFTQLLLPAMVERKWGRIINVSSSVALGAPYLTSALYVAAKAGMLGFTRHVAAEVAAHGVTVNATIPGLTLSERIANVMTPEMIADREKIIPAGRLSRPEEQASAIVFLCSDKASYITGATINTSGGLTWH